MHKNIIILRTISYKKAAIHQRPERAHYLAKYVCSFFFVGKMPKVMSLDIAEKITQIKLLITL